MTQTPFTNFSNLLKVPVTSSATLVNACQCSCGRWHGQARREGLSVGPSWRIHQGVFFRLQPSKIINPLKIVYQMVDTHLMVRLNNLPGCFGIKSLMRCFIMTFWNVLQTAVLSCYEPPKCKFLLNLCVLVSLVSVRLLGLAENAHSPCASNRNSDIFLVSTNKTY